MEEEIILSQIIEDAQKEALRIRQEAESLAKKIEEENTEKVRREMQEKFEIIKAKIMNHLKNSSNALENRTSRRKEFVMISSSCMTY